jgi:hypothetical protein
LNFEKNTFRKKGEIIMVLVYPISKCRHTFLESSKGKPNEFDRVKLSTF